MTDEQDIEKCGFQPKFRHVVLLAFLCLIVAWVGFRFTMKGRLEEAYEQIRADGYPATPVEHDAWYSIPDGVENAADVIIEASGYYANLDEEKQKLLPIIGQAELPEPGKPMPEKMLKVIGEFVEDNAQALELLHKAAAIEHSRYPIDLSLGIASFMPDLGAVKKGALRLKLEAIYYAETGDVEKAVESVKAAFGIARSLSNEPTLISYLVEIACRALAISSMEEMLCRAELTDEQLTELYEIIENEVGSDSFERAFAGERCSGASFFNMPASKSVGYVSSPGFSPEMIGIAAYKAVGMADVDELLYIDIMSDYVAAARLPLADARKGFKAASSRFENLSMVHVMLLMIAPSLGKVAEFEMRSQATLSAARAAIAVERYRLENGRTPRKLSDLVPEYMQAVPIDPFDGNELRYKRLYPGFVVYSVGEDGVDNGGQKREPGHTGYDWPVTISR